MNESRLPWLVPALMAVLDASALLISVMDFLPADHPRLLATIDRIERELSVDGFVYRFDPATALNGSVSLLGDFEAAFLPCTFWLATAYAKAGDPSRAERILERADAIRAPSHQPTVLSSVMIQTS